MGKNRGFTLIELMVTIAILAIIAMLAVPTFGDLVEKQDLNKSTQNLVGQLNSARSRAVLERRNVIVELNSSLPDTSSILYWNPTGAAVLKSGSPTSVEFLLSGGVKDFDAKINGQPFIICSKAGGVHAKRVSISLMGTVQIEEGAC